MRTDRQTDRLEDMTKLIVAFRNFDNAPKNERKSKMCENKRNETRGIRI